MNEPASMCRFPCLDPASEASKLGMPPEPPPVRDPPRKLPGFNMSLLNTHSTTHIDSAEWDLQAANFITSAEHSEERIQSRGLSSSGEDFVFPPYKIHNGGPSGDLSDLTVRTDLLHANGMLEYDLHNLYGTSKGAIYWRCNVC
jgi:alpha-glucosidase